MGKGKYIKYKEKAALDNPHYSFLTEDEMTTNKEGR